MHKHRGFIIAAVALAACAALFRLRPSAEAHRGVVQVTGTSIASTGASTGFLSGEMHQGRPELVVYVVGAVKRPGVYRLASGTRIEAAVRAAGGTSVRADPIGVNLAQPLRDGEEIVVPERGSWTQRSSDSSTICSIPRRRGRKRSSYSYEGSRRTSTGLIAGSNLSSGTGGDASRVDVNRADAAELATLPGIGPHLAERIVAFRRSNGPFGRLDEMLDVNGVTEHVLDAIEPFVVFDR